MQEGIHRTLIFDPAITGHHSEYIGHLVNYLHGCENLGNRYIFVVNPEFSNKFPKIASTAKETAEVVWHEIDPSEFNNIRGNSLNTSWSSYRILQRYAKKFEADHVCALDFHIIKYGGIFIRPPYTLSSILFVQFHRLKKESLSEKWTYYKRYFLTKLISYNHKIDTIFVLNDKETANYMNQEFETDMFQMLPDPIPKLVPLEDFDIYAHYKIEKKRKIFLHIGSLGTRKGTFEAIESVNYIDKRKQAEVALLVVGRASSEEDERAILQQVKIQNKESEVQLVWDNRFVPTPMMKSLFNQCHAVLIPYKNAEFSSGILGHAAAANKMVIATGAGLLKEMVLKNGLGLLVRNPNAEEIADKIGESLALIHTSPSVERFVEAHSPEKFAKLVLNLK